MQTYKWLDTNLSNQDTPQKCPYDISEVQQHHVFEKQRWKSKLGYEVPQTFSLALCDDVTPGWGVGDKYTFTLGTYYISQPIFWKTGQKHGLILNHLPACYIATQYDAKALQESWEELVYGHVRSCSRPCQSAMGDVLPMD